jgi:hypothetical protein
MNFLDIFQNPDGSGSSRRVFGILLICAGIVLNALKLLDDQVTIYLCGMGSVLLGLTTLDKR